MKLWAFETCRILLFIICFSNKLLAQPFPPDPISSEGITAESTYLLSGCLLEKGNKDPVLGGSLFLEALGNSANAKSILLNTGDTSSSVLSSAPPNISSRKTYSTDSDLKGNYKVYLPAGTYRLLVVGEGFKKLMVKAITINQKTIKNFYLERDSYLLPEVIVSTNKISQTQVSQETLSKQELTEVPGTQEDILKAIQALPGVITAGSLDGQLLVRGSGPDDNQYYVDNVPIGFPYHFGIVSTLDSNLVKDIDFYEGGFGPQYPNSMGGLVDLPAGSSIGSVGFSGGCEFIFI